MEKLKFHYSYRDHWSKVTRTFDTREEVSKFIQERWNEKYDTPISLGDISYSPASIVQSYCRLYDPLLSVNVKTKDGTVSVGLVYRGLMIKEMKNDI